ncbi:SDR family NAD(P)-dependent oxidoreductase [Caldicellulosiruptor morganii]|uniref:SDR family oxidoreductase n=1 Tax=Caldicellulosiruptor morganii TaxID=1387555 RepID=A0ABY7BN72_9FIRM|nr:SDR family oxidoreductase [Caldicellulosiruptor morganii]WAM33491.1 SDR family oxidoreductase [Caldicellulosiruptor morganii]
MVTGGTRGIGKAIVRRFVEAGATVVFTGRNPDALKRAEEKFTAAGGKVLGVQADSGRIEDAKRVINLTVEKFGHIDILVNNTAVFPASTAMDMTEEIWDETFDVDTKGAFFFAKFAAEAMIASGRGGRIINILSTAAFQIASPLIAYGAAKASLWYITQAMAQELAKYHILVNAVTPGATLTAERIAALINGNLVESTLGSNVSETMKKMESTLKNKGIARMLSKLTPLGRPGYPDDIAKAVLFLASDMASYITGVNIIVDGGQTLKNERFDVDDDDESTTNTITHEQSTGGSDKLLEGTYKAIIKTPMGAQEVIFTFHVEDNILTGTVSALGNSFEIENGKVTADGFSFQYTIKAPIGKVKVHVNGKLDGDKILCNLKTFMGSIPFEGTRV